MFKHISLASSSKGNCHLISQDNGKTFIMLDCGIPYNQIKEKLFKLGIMFHQVKGCIITHNHGDHIRAASDLSKYMTIYLTEGTKEVYKKKVKEFSVIRSQSMFKVNRFTVLPFEVKHDAEEPVNFILMNKSGQYMIYVTDTGTLDFKLENLRPTYVLIESNFDQDKLEVRLAEIDRKYDEGNAMNEKDQIYKYRAERNLTKDNGHLSVQKTIDILKNQISLDLCEQITLCHVSETNGLLTFHSMVSKALDGKFKVNQLHASKVQVIEIKDEEVY